MQLDLPGTTPTMKSKVIAILSGGLDSTVLAHHITTLRTLELVGCVSVNYGQRHRKELDCAERTALQLNVPFDLVDLSGMANVLTSALTQPGQVPEGHYEADSMKATVVPNRNMLLMAVAAGVAISRGANHIAYGAHAGDHAIYPDCRDEFAQAMNNALNLCHFEPVILYRPFISYTKADIVRLGKALGVPFENTWTCYNGLPIACGKCGTCVERLEAFHLAGEEDPLAYADRSYWVDAVRGTAGHPELPSA